MTRPLRRRPELRPRALAGRGLAAARELRVAVDDDGALVVHRPGGRREVRARPGEVVRAVYVAGDRRGPVRLPVRTTSDLLVLLGAQGPVLALLLLDWMPPADSDAEVARRTTGFSALLAALGLPLEPAEPQDLERLRAGALHAVLLRPQPPLPWPGRPRWLLLPASLLLCVAVSGAGRLEAGAALAALLLGVPPTVAWLRARGAAQRAPAGPRPPGRPVTVSTRPTAPLPAGLAAARLELGPDDVVIVDRGREAWLPGPAAGGVTTAEIGTRAVRLRDSRGDSYARLERAVWCADDAATDAFTTDLVGAGLQVTTSPYDLGPPTRLGSLAEGPVDRRDWSRTERGDGNETMDVESAVFALLALLATEAVGSISHLLAVLVAALALALLAATAGTVWQRRRTDRQDRRTSPRATPAGAR
ncbi:MAG TPA: hypothetical protein VFR07_12585 [Mycobacteriales bacterium]|jgi:hypothetical protein|nr:hypothetical protein [Mycobacteriales bacterium]